ncbi:Serpentine receptor class alpha/beta-14 [Toxocara canis]|uniref:Serpentine receptor class alpha/beta-14 n=1 Tax=Toxocara canis TaxID=6265 RepID=A0A0B2UXC6_TOXCA|nr:Serpentine receptor class alpha/beta-14 [Toxocara canis]
MPFSSPCEYYISRALSFNLAAIVLVFILLQMTSMIALTIERTIATIRYMKYEKEKSITIPVLLIALQLIIAFFIPYGYLMYGTDWSLPATDPSLVTQNNLVRNQLFTIGFVASELAVMVFTYVLLYWNRRRRRAVRKWNSQSGLSTRYQLDENIRVLDLILPFMWLQFVFNFTTGVMVYIFVAVGKDISYLTYCICERLSGILTLYPIALLILLLCKDPIMIARFLKTISLRPKSKKIHSTISVSVISKRSCVGKIASKPHFVVKEDADAHFNQLKIMFEGHRNKPEK